MSSEMLSASRSPHFGSTWASRQRLMSAAPRRFGWAYSSTKRAKRRLTVKGSLPLGELR